MEEWVTSGRKSTQAGGTVHAKVLRWAEHAWGPGNSKGAGAAAGLADRGKVGGVVGKGVGSEGAGPLKWGMHRLRE